MEDGKCFVAPERTMNDDLGFRQDIMDTDPRLLVAVLLEYLPFTEEELQAICAELGPKISGTPYRASVEGTGVLRLYCEVRAAWPVAQHTDRTVLNGFYVFADTVCVLLKARRAERDVEDRLRSLRGEER